LRGRIDIARHVCNNLLYYGRDGVFFFTHFILLFAFKTITQFISEKASHRTWIRHIRSHWIIRTFFIFLILCLLWKPRLFIGPQLICMIRKIIKYRIATSFLKPQRTNMMSDYIVVKLQKYSHNVFL
jgi:hypothetical protein